LSLQPVIRALAPDDLLSADEAFLTNSIIGIWPLKSVGGRALPRGPRAADICRTLAAAGVIVPP
jgi:branched-subunit amino acid aminotransferase/4-amino-4-deoxychorismate lyase